MSRRSNFEMFSEEEKEAQWNAMDKLDMWILQNMKEKGIRSKEWYIKEKLGVSITTYNRYHDRTHFTQMSSLFLAKALILMQISAGELFFNKPAPTLEQGEASLASVLKKLIPGLTEEKSKQAENLIIDLIHLLKE